MTKIALRAHNKIGTHHYHHNCSCHIQKRANFVNFVWQLQEDSRYFVDIYYKADGKCWSCVSRSSSGSLRKMYATLRASFSFRQWKTDHADTVRLVVNLSLINRGQTLSWFWVWAVVWVNSSVLVDDFFFFIAESSFCTNGWWIIYTVIEWRQEVVKREWTLNMKLQSSSLQSTQTLYSN